MKIVVFTGAGAGRADGIPLQTELFEQFFSRVPANARRAQLVTTVADFFSRAFEIDARTARGHTLPTFEEALGILDLAIAREETILSIGDGATGISALRSARRELILSLAATIGHEPSIGGTVHAQLVKALRTNGLLDDITFVTANYDTLIDEAIDAEAVEADRGTGTLIDYGINELAGGDQDPHRDMRSFPCFKIHGSLNWLYCPACDLLDITFASNGAIRLVDEPDGARCYECETLRTPIIVPPSYYKNMSNVYLGVVWTKAYQAIRQADQIVFCGYSFPDADMHVRYLVKRAQLNRDAQSHPLQILLVNHYPSKNTGVAVSERERFTRFLGQNVVDTGKSFEDFARAPREVLSL
ncbi:MAG: SIR2 family protein [Gemmatimonadaceae bacterium]|nr:SIR2 family protein [Gemmatimonadaceae bacterium]